MAAQSSGSSSSNKTNTADDDNLGNKVTKGKTLDKNKLPFDLSDINPETIEKIKSVIDSANSLLTDDERKHNEEVKRKQIESNKKFEDALEKETRKEVFEIPKGSSKTYNFIGYDSEQYQELMTIGNQADAMEDKRTIEFLKLQMDVYKKTILYSLEGISMEVINKLPKRTIQWLYLVMKDKNENPLPFEVNV